MLATPLIPIACRHRRLVYWILFFATAGSNLSAQSREGDKSPTLEHSGSDARSTPGRSTDKDPLIAKIGKQEILWSELVYRWRVGGLKFNDIHTVDSIALVEGVEAARKQRIAQAQLDRRGLGATATEVDQWIASRIQGIEAAKLTANDLARQEGLSLESWQRELRWQKSWEQFTQQVLTRERLQTHFENHQEWFDGTQRDVFHVIRPIAWNDLSGREKAIGEFRELAAKIRSQELTFEEAAKKWSSGATAEQGGRLGWMTYQGPMHPSFHRAAFELREGAVSEPVETPHGVHLIWVRSVKRGDLPYDRVMETVRRSLLVEEFEQLVKAYPKSPPVEWLYDPKPNPKNN